MPRSPASYLRDALSSSTLVTAAAGIAPQSRAVDTAARDVMSARNDTRKAAAAASA